MDPVFGFDDRRPIRALGWAVLVLLVAGALAFVARGADRPANPTLAARGRVGDFAELAFRVDHAGGHTTGCALVADTPAKRARGLMGVRDLALHDGMLFVDFPVGTSPAFTMQDTILPLTVAWFDGQGRFVGSADMDPCVARPRCPAYASPAAYRIALEVPRGGLQHLGIGPGAHLTAGGACT